MFRIDYDRAANLLRIKVWGLLKPEDVPALAQAVDAGAREAQAHRDDFNVIVESLDFPVQADDVADMITGIMRAGMALTSGRTAIVVDSVLNKEQVERTLVHPRVRAFMTMGIALGWLEGRVASLS